MNTITSTSTLGEVWMQVRDHRKLARLALIQDVSHRDIARAVGWTAHSYVGRLMRGEVRTVSTDAGTRIAHLLCVAVDDLFVTKSSSHPGRNSQSSAA